MSVVEDSQMKQSQFDHEETGYRICPVSGTILVHRPWNDPIPKKFNIVYRLSVNTSEDSVGDWELLEKENELTVLDNLEDSDGKSTVGLSTCKQPEESLEEIKYNTSDQNQERFIKSEQDTLQHEEIYSPVTASSKEFNCPPGLRESSTLIFTPADNTWGKYTQLSRKH